jgi:hypothetical protein
MHSGYFPSQSIEIEASGTAKRQDFSIETASFWSKTASFWAKKRAKSGVYSY